MLPSAPTVIPSSKLVWYDVIVPVGVMRSTASEPSSVNHRFPSGPGAMALGSRIPSNSVIVPVGPIARDSSRVATRGC